MPRVPTVDGPTVAASPLPDAFQRAPAAIGGPGQVQSAMVGEALRQATRVADAFQRQRDIDDEARVDGALNALAERDTDLSFGEAGFTRLRGEAALKGANGRAPADEFTEALQQTAGQLEGELSNDRQKRLFALKANNQVAGFRRRALGHAGQQQDVYNDQQTQASIEIHQQRMALAWQDPDMLVESQQTIRETVAKAGAAAGSAPEVVAAATVRALSPGHASVLAAAIDEGQLDFAREYLKDASGEMLPAARLQVQKALNIGTEQAKAQTLAGDLWTKHGGDAAKALADARSALQGKEEDEVVQRLKVLDTERQAFTSRAEREAYDSALLRVEQGQGVPASLLAAMGDGHAAAIRARQRAMVKAAEAEAAGRPVKTDWVKYLELRQQAQADPKQFSGVDLKQFVDRIAGPQLEQLMDIQTKVRDPSKAPEVATSEQQIGAYTRQMDLKGERLGQFQSAAFDLFNEHLKSKGKEPTFDERQAILDGLTKEIVLKPGWLWDSKGPAYTAPREVRSAAMAPADKFTAGRVYTDKAGNRARYMGGGKWEPVE
jgi:hypothetical protein